MNGGGVFDVTPRVSSIPLDWAVRAPGRTVFVSAGRPVTYAEFAEIIRTAREVLAEVGTCDGDRVVVMGLNGVETAAFMFAAQELDAWPAILNPRLSADEVAANIALVDPRVIVFIDADCEEAQVHAARHGAVRTRQISTVLIASCSAQSAEIPSRETPRIGALLFTSGTTGKPRAVMLSNRALRAIGEGTVQHGKYQDDDVVYGVAPFAHIIGLGTVLLGSLCAGAAVELAPRFDLPALVSAIRTGRITRIVAVPLIYSKLLDHLDGKAIDVSGHRLRALASGGAPLDPSLKARVEERFGVGLINGYGCTEIAPIARSDASVGGDAHAGRPFDGVEVRLIAAERDVAAGEVGEVWVRGPSLMEGYFRDPGATAAVLRPGGWLATGDLGRFDGAGNLSIVGRIKELILRSGFNVYPAEVEAVLNAHAAVLQSAVVGRSTADGNEEVIAFVQPHSNVRVSPEEIKRYAAQRLTPYKRPAVVSVLAQLPIGPTGKIMKRELQRLAETL